MAAALSLQVCGSGDNGIDHYQGNDFKALALDLYYMRLLCFN